MTQRFQSGGWLTAAVLLAPWRPATGQAISDYLVRLPPTSLLVPQVDTGSLGILLYGDTRNTMLYVAPYQLGVEKEHSIHLLSLAKRFAPRLHRTNFSAPRDFEEVLTLTAKDTLGGYLVYCDTAVYLHRDIWDVSGASPKRVDSARVSLGVLPLIPCPMGRGDTVFTPEAWKRLGRTGKRPTPIRSSKPDTLRRVYPAPDNDALIDLLDSMAPERSGSGPLRSGQRVSRTTVLYLDFPGNSSRSWSEIYRELARDTLLALRTYVHPFIFEHASSRSRDRFELIFQYWFFYPFNDGANDHEGDWEHINVSVTTRDRMASMAGERRLLDWTDLDRILEPGSNADDVVLSAVDYYFHHFVVTVDYHPIYDRQHGDSSRRRPFAQWLVDSSAYSVASAPRGHCSSAIDTTALSGLWGRDLQEATEPFYDRTIQERFGYRIDSVMTLLPCGKTFTLRFARRAETKIADWLLDWVSDDSLATHPVGYIAGNNKSVFQLLESRSGNNNNSHGTYPFPGIWRGIAPGSSEKVGGGRPRKERAGSEEFLNFGEKELTLVADWERRTVSLSNDPERRRDWAWLVLPIRWGYPATQSPGAELLKNFDFGQAAPEGPAFNLGWNSVGAGPGFERYDPASLSLLLNNSPVDYMDNRWGRWNIPILGLAALPPISALASIGGVAFTRYVKKEPGVLLSPAGVSGPQESHVWARLDPGRAIVYPSPPWERSGRSRCRQPDCLG